ncbi:hypothetical protein TNCV_2147881 [Trichonephila clavipes]|uniref:Uncharacterized protein n=1 Tax=Trichonephila clavipes TaxID=2585209 RepID=A0A8X6SY32_TRICX|nr:hypothetical protein TNCV_2147881 [Trichonephila clavipes]
MSRSGGQSEARPPVFKSSKKLSTHLSTQCRNRDYTGMWVRLGSTDLMAGKVMFLRSNQSGRFDGNESAADSFRSDLWYRARTRDKASHGPIPIPLSVRGHISSQSSRHCWRSSLPHASALIQRDFRCVLGVQQTKKLPHVAKIDLVWQLGM